MITPEDTAIVVKFLRRIVEIRPRVIDFDQGYTVLSGREFWSHRRCDGSTAAFRPLLCDQVFTLPEFVKHCNVAYGSCCPHQACPYDGTKLPNSMPAAHLGTKKGGLL